MIEEDETHFKIEKESLYACGVIVGVVFAAIGLIGGYVALLAIPSRLAERLEALEGK